MEENIKGGKANSLKWIISMLAVAGISFTVSMFIFKKIGYDEGVRFAVTSGSKQGYAIGFEMGYQMRDSLAKKALEMMRASNQFNLSIIEQEAGTPKDFILLTGAIVETEVPKVGLKNQAAIRIISTAQFARYRDIVLSVKYLDKRNNPLKEQLVTPDNILYPGKTVVVEIPYQDVPEFAEILDVKLVSATGID